MVPIVNRDHTGAPEHSCVPKFPYGEFWSRIGPCPFLYKKNGTQEFAGASFGQQVLPPFGGTTGSNIHPALDIVLGEYLTGSFIHEMAPELALLCRA